MLFIRKDLQHAHISKTEPGRIITFGATPYEPTTFPVNAIPILSDGIAYEGKPTGGFVVGTGGANARADVKLVNAKGSGMGWTFTHEAKGRGYDYSQLKGNRSLATYIWELTDGADSTWQCISGGLVAKSIILPDGVSSRRGPGGLDILTIQSATPDYFLGNLELPTMSYILGTPANNERFTWWFICKWGWDPNKPPPSPLPNSADLIKASAQNLLGQTFKDTSGAGIAAGNYQDPFGGFGYYTDDYTLTVGQAMQPRPCNLNHLLAYLSSSRIVVEILRNHVTANGVPLENEFSLEVLTDFDIEKDILTGEVSGTINSIIQEMASHGVWRAWWDSQSNFHFIPDYYAPYFFRPVLKIEEGPSLIGELQVNLGTDQKRVNRAEVKGQPFISFGDARTDPLTTNINMALGAVYPPGAAKGGNNATMDNYMGRNTGEQAHRMYNKANAKTTFRWSNFPYPTLAFGLLNRAIAITAKDPKKNWDFTAKLFVVTDVEIQLNDADRPDGGYYLCSIAGIEI